MSAFRSGSDEHRVKFLIEFAGPASWNVDQTPFQIWIKKLKVSKSEEKPPGRGSKASKVISRESESVKGWLTGSKLADTTFTRDDILLNFKFERKAEIRKTDENKTELSKWRETISANAWHAKWTF